MNVFTLHLLRHVWPKKGDTRQKLRKALDPAPLSDTSGTYYIVQYWREIEQSVVSPMQMLAIARSVMYAATVRFGIIDGQDSSRLVRAYPKAFAE